MFVYLVTTTKKLKVINQISKNNLNQVNGLDFKHTISVPFTNRQRKFIIQVRYTYMKKLS